MDWRIILAACSLILALLALLHQLIIKRRDATIEAQDKEIARLKTLLDEAKNASPDVLAERYKKKIERLESDLKELLNETESDKIAIAVKEQELQSVMNQAQELKEQMERARLTFEEELEFVKSRIDACPICDAEVVEKAYLRAYFDGEDGTFVQYTCGYVEVKGVIKYPCSKDPKFPTLNDYYVVAEYKETESIWVCSALPKTELAALLHLGNKVGNTEEEARQRFIEASTSFLKKRPIPQD